MEALGMVEIIGYSSAVVILDQMLKTSNVRFLKLEKVKSGFVTLFVEGQVSDVKTAVDAGKAVAISCNSYVSSSVIARASQGLENIIVKEKVKKEVVKKQEIKQEEIKIETPNNEEKKDLTKNIEEPKKEAKDVVDTNKNKKYDVEVLEKTTVSNLRSMLRKEKVSGVQSNKIKFMDKASLVKHLSSIAN